MTTQVDVNFTIANRLADPASIIIEPDAEQLVIAPSTSLAFIESHPLSEPPPSIFVYEEGLSIYGYDIAAYGAYTDARNSRHTSFARPDAQPKSSEARPSEEARTQSHLTIVGRELELLRPEETETPVTVQIVPSGDKLVLQPGQSVAIILSGQDAQHPDIEIREAGITVLGTVKLPYRQPLFTLFGTAQRLIAERRVSPLSTSEPSLLITGAVTTSDSQLIELGYDPAYEISVEWDMARSQLNLSIASQRLAGTGHRTLTAELTVASRRFSADNRRGNVIRFRQIRMTQRDWEDAVVSFPLQLSIAEMKPATQSKGAMPR